MRNAILCVCVCMLLFDWQSISMQTANVLTFSKWDEEKKNTKNNECVHEWGDFSYMQKDYNRRTKRERKPKSKRTQFLCCCEWLIVRKFWEIFFSSLLLLIFDSLRGLMCTVFFSFFFFVRDFELSTNARQVTNYMQIQRTIAGQTTIQCRILMPFFPRFNALIKKKFRFFSLERRKNINASSLTSITIVCCMQNVIDEFCVPMIRAWTNKLAEDHHRWWNDRFFFLSSKTICTYFHPCEWLWLSFLAIDYECCSLLASRLWSMKLAKMKWKPVLIGIYQTSAWPVDPIFQSLSNKTHSAL